MTSGLHPSQLDREKVEFQDGEKNRVYTHEAISPVPSVTTVLNEKKNPEKKESLSGWRDWFDGSTEKRSPHWRDQMHFKQNRGTIVHYDVGNVLGDVPLTDDERKSREKLQNWWAWKPSSYPYGTVADGDLPDNAFEKPSVPQEIYEEAKAYLDARRDGEDHAAALEISDASIRTRQYLTGIEDENTYDGTNAFEKAQNDSEWAVSVAESDLTDDFPADNVVDTETYVLDTEWGYAGQFDLLCRDDDGDLWVGDLKTSSSIDRIGYRLQLSAYAYAHEDEIKGAFLFRLDPDDEVVKVETNRDWERSMQGLENEFLSLCERTHVHRLPDFSS